MGADILTVDSGGSKTKLILWHDARPVKTMTVRGFGTASDCAEPIAELGHHLQDFCMGAEVKKAACNLGGKNKTQIINTLRQALPNTESAVFRESEGEVGRALCRIYDAQVALLAGTGSIAIAPVGDFTIISGGWGANISDEGSGYHLGLCAIRSALKQLDGTAPLSELTKAITGVSTQLMRSSAAEYCALRDRVRARMAPLDRAHIAEFARTVCAYAQQGDVHALDLLQETGQALADLVIQTAKKTGRPLARIVVTGGMVHSQPFWQDSFERRLRIVYETVQGIYLTDGINEAIYTLANDI